MEVVAPVRAGAILHAGCGPTPLPDWIQGEETRLDIDSRCKPDIVAPMTNLGEIGPFDMVFCSHALEHLAPQGAMDALMEFRRVLNPGGRVMIIVPNLEGIEPTFDVVYETEAGEPITGFDMIYGNLKRAATNPFMAHRCGFVTATLENALEAAGFTQVCVVNDDGERRSYNLIGMGVK